MCYYNARFMGGSNQNFTVARHSMRSNETHGPTESSEGNHEMGSSAHEQSAEDDAK